MWRALAGTLLGLLIIRTGVSQDQSQSTLRTSQQLFVQAQQPTGVLVPLYHYPANVHTNPVYNHLITLKKKYPTIPVCAIINPDNGPGGPLDANYTKAIDRLSGAGVFLIGYVSTKYGQQAQSQVISDIGAWHERSRKISGIFLDEMANAAKAESVNYYAQVTSQAHQLGFWPVFANPGTSTPELYFTNAAADVFIIHENDHWPTEKDLKGDYFGGYADYPPWTRGVLVHSQPRLDKARLNMVRQHVRWVYVTDDKLENPWDQSSLLLEETMHQLSEISR